MAVQLEGCKNKCLGICPGYCCHCFPISVIEGRKKKGDKKAQKETFEVDVKDKQNIIHEKAKFARRCQEQGQTAEAFVTADHSFAEYCIYRMLKEELIRGKIILAKETTSSSAQPTLRLRSLANTGLSESGADLHTSSTGGTAADQ